MNVINPLFVLLLVFTYACQAPDSSTAESSRAWELVWSDEFEGDSLQQPDTTQWVFDMGRGDNGWGNGEWQYYTDRPKNAFLNGEGHLVIRAYKERYENAAYTSARLKTKGKVEQRYGKFEARILAPTGVGIWPAFWMLGANIDQVGWPKCGEIDIMEVIGESRNEIHGSLHGPGHAAGDAVTTTYRLPKGQVDSAFHLYSVEWSESAIQFFVDGVKYQEVQRSDLGEEWVYNTPFYLLINLAIGGTYVGYPSEDEVFPKDLIVDYVRIYTHGSNKKINEK